MLNVTFPNADNDSNDSEVLALKKEFSNSIKTLSTCLIEMTRWREIAFNLIEESKRTREHALFTIPILGYFVRRKYLKQKTEFNNAINQWEHYIDIGQATLKFIERKREAGHVAQVILLEELLKKSLGTMKETKNYGFSN